MNPVAKTAQKPATYEDLLKVPDNLVAEIIEGELFTSPRPSSPHLRASSLLGGRIVTSFDDGGGGPGGWWILDEPELHFGANVLVPDIAGWRRERMPILGSTPGRWSLLGTYGGDDTVRIEPFDAIEFPLATLWLPEATPA